MANPNVPPDNLFPNLLPNPILNANQDVQQNQILSPVSVRVPIFWKANPRIWFCQIEAQFANSRIINDFTKYNTVVASLEGHILSQVSDVILNPPNVNLYDTLKSKLLERFEESEQSRLNTLLNSLTLGDKKPTHLLRQMRELAGGTITDTPLKSLFLQRLPQQAQAMFSISDQPLDQIAILADRFLEVTSCDIAAVQCNSINNDNSIISLIENLKLEMAELKVTLGKQNFNTRRSRSRSSSHSYNPRKRSNSRPMSKDGLCWYHNRFKGGAKRCIKPCKFVETEN